MKSTVAFLRERKQKSSESRGRGDRPAVSPPGSVPLADFDQPEWPDPKEVVDAQHIALMAKTHQRTQVESRGENKKYHVRLAHAVVRKFTAAAHAALERLEKELANTQRQLAERQRQKKQFDRYRHRRSGKKGKDQRKLCTRWIQAQFAAVVAVMVMAILNGTFSVSSAMLDSTMFSGAYAKTITVALGFFLLPGLGLSIPFHLLRAYPRLAYGYLTLLVCAGICFGFLFAVTWAHTFAVETGNQTLIDLTMIGLGSEPEVEVAKPWLFENANWLSLLFQILADMAFAGAAKSYLSYLSWNYHLFRDKAFQQDPEWLELDREVRELSARRAELEAEKCRATERLTDLEAEAEEFTEAVSACADGLFLQEVDRFEKEQNLIRSKETELREKEVAWRRSQQELNDLLTKNPGAHLEGESNA